MRFFWGILTLLTFCHPIGAQTMLPSEKEEEHWARIHDSKDPNELRDFLVRFPQGRFESPAEIRLSLLRSIPPGFVLIDPGSFRGYTGVVFHLSQGFFMSEHEVTIQDYRKFDPSVESFDCSQSDCPVVEVSWDEVQKYIQWLNQKEGRAVFRLPTEAEWRYAAQAGTTTPYTCGNDPFCMDDYAWYHRNSAKKAHPVKTKKPNPWNLYDMHGNVSEWVADWYGSLPTEEVTDYQGPDKGRTRVSLGGGWRNDVIALDWQNRSNASSDSHNSNLGFRLVRNLL